MLQKLHNQNCSKEQQYQRLLIKGHSHDQKFFGGVKNFHKPIITTIVPCVYSIFSKLLEYSELAS